MPLLKAGAAMGCIAWVPIDGDDHIDIDEVLVSEISGHQRAGRGDQFSMTHRYGRRRP